MIQDGLAERFLPMHDLATLVEEPQMASLDIWRQFVHPVAGPQTTLTIPWGVLGRDRAF